MHAAPVLEHLDSLCHRGLVPHDGPGLYKVPAILQAEAAEVAGAGCVVKRLAAPDA